MYSCLTAFTVLFTGTHYTENYVETCYKTLNWYGISNERQTKHICSPTLQKVLIVVELLCCFIIAYVQTTHYCRSRRAISDFEKRSVFFIQTKNDGLLFYWICYCFFTMLDDVRPGSTI